MSKAHVPPQAAGNTLLSKRHWLLIKGHEVDAGRQELGGIFIYGLCEDCNGRAGIYDTAYRDFTEQLRPFWVKSWQVQVPRLISTPEVPIDPGGVIRSILLGMCATSPLMGRKWPGLPLSLASGTQVDLPQDMRIFLALSRGLTARVAGPIAGFHLYGPNARRDQSGTLKGINSVASVYFPPVAWELIHTGETVLHEAGWAEVGSWTEHAPGTSMPLTDLVPALPTVCHPWHHPTANEHWCELMSSEITDVVECANVTGGPPDPMSPPTLFKRAHLTTDEMTELARSNGIVG